MSNEEVTTTVVVDGNIVRFYAVWPNGERVSVRIATHEGTVAMDCFSENNLLWAHYHKAEDLRPEAVEA